MKRFKKCDNNKSNNNYPVFRAIIRASDVNVWLELRIEYKL